MIIPTWGSVCCREVSSFGLNTVAIRTTITRSSQFTRQYNHCANMCQSDTLVFLPLNNETDYDIKVFLL